MRESLRENEHSWEGVRTLRGDAMLVDGQAGNYESVSPSLPVERDPTWLALKPCGEKAHGIGGRELGM